MKIWNCLMEKKFIALIILISILNVFGCTKKDEKTLLAEKVKPHVDQGTKAYQSGNYALAIEEWRKAQEINPKLDYLHSNMGMAYKFAGQPEKALEEFQKYAESRPKDAHVWNNIGSIYREQGDNAKAIEFYKKAISLYADYHLPHYNLGLIYREMGDYDKAIQHLTKANQIHNKDYMSLLYLGKTWRAKGNSAKSLEALQKAKEISPLNPEVRYEYALELYNQKKYEEAESQFKELMVDYPEYGNVYHGLALVLWKKDGQTDEALGLIEEALKKDPMYKYKYLESMGRIYLEIDQLDNALESLKTALENIPDYLKRDKAEILYYLGKCYEKQDNTAEARSNYEKALQLFPDIAFAKEIKDYLNKVS